MTHATVALRLTIYPAFVAADGLDRAGCSGMLLNSDELIGFVHLPSSAVRSAAFQRDTGKSKAAPQSVRSSSGLLLGNNVHAGNTTAVRLSPESRVRHAHIIGASGTGKSTLLFNLISQDIQNGQGLAVLDPHGDLIDRILGSIPAERVADVILFDASDETHSIGFNILTAHSDLEKTLLASDLISVFQRLSASWGDQMGSVLQNAILAFLESSRGGTLADLRRFLLDAEFRNEFLTTVHDPDLVYYWRKGFPQLGGNKSIGPVLTRLETFLAPKPIRYIVSQPANRLDFADIMDSGKIFLVKLSQGQIGKENAFLLGSLLMSKFQQTAMSRQAKAIAARKDFWLYLDEFHHFITPSMAEILGGARKYRMGLTLAHQELRQLQRDSEVASAVLSNYYTRVVFRVGDDDARKLAEGFAFFEARDLQNLDIGQAIARVERSDFDFNLAVPLPTEPDEATASQRRQEIITVSREKYATPRAEVEAMLSSRIAPVQPKAPTPAPVKAAAYTATPPAAPPVSELPKVAEVPQPPQPVAPKPPVEKNEPALDASEDESEHQALKTKIGIEAEALDYTVAFEELVPPGKGRADVVLRRGSLTIACEVTVKCPAEYEVGNLHKCLAGGFPQVAMISANAKKLERIRRLFSEAATPEQTAKVRFYAVEEFLSQLLEWAADDPQGAAVERGKPRKQKISLLTSLLSNEERQAREQEMLRQIREAMRKGAPA